MTDRLKLAYSLAVFATLWPTKLAISDFWPYVPETDYVPRLFELLGELWKITMTVYGQ